MFEFEWDRAKAANNRRKHGIEFEDARTVFWDPLRRTIADEEHSQFEQRWITMGRTPDGKLLVVCHTDRETDEGRDSVRLISARSATPGERRQYESGK